MKIESSHLVMHMEHHSERQLATASMILPAGQAPGASFADLFSYLRQQPAAANGTATPTPDTAPPTPGALMANIAGARDLIADEDDRQDRLLRLVEELLVALESLLLKVGQGEQDCDADAISEKIAAGDQETEQQGQGRQWTRVTLTHQTESESLCFASQGCVRTADGREIDFELSLSMSRETETTSLDMLSGRLSKLVDPLVLNYPGQAAELTGATIAFDLSGDSQLEKLPILAGCSGYLALDRNGDGCINDGTELFGASSGNGFADLAQLDDDGNQWLDEGDAAFSKLLLWRPSDKDGGEPVGLHKQGIGALSLQSLKTPFSLKDAEGNLQAAVRRSGLWLGEQGGAGSLQHLDVAT